MTAPSVEQRVEAHRERMSPAALRVARFLIDHPERALVATAAEIARAARTSDATVVRAVQTLGYSGLPELRRDFGEMLASRYDPRDRFDDSVERVRAAPRSVLDTVIEDSIALLNETKRMVDHDEFTRVCAQLASARRIVVIAWGQAASIADYAALGLTRLGRVARSVTASGFRLADDLVALGEGDVILLLAPLLHVHEIDVVLSRASAAGVPSILVTEILGERLRDRVRHTITVAPSRRYAADAFIASIAVIDALVLALAAGDPARVRATWTAINEIRQDFSTAGFTAVLPPIEPAPLQPSARPPARRSPEL